MTLVDYLSPLLDSVVGISGSGAWTTAHSKVRQRVREKHYAYRHCFSRFDRAAQSNQVNSTFPQRAHDRCAPLPFCQISKPKPATNRDCADVADGADAKEPTGGDRHAEQVRSWAIRGPAHERSSSLNL